MNEEKIRQIVKEETAHLATKVDVLGIKVDKLSDDIADLKESFEVQGVKLDALMNMTEHFIVKVEKEEQERKFGDIQLERRVEKLEAKV